MINVSKLARRLFDSRNGELVVGGVPVGEIAETTGTPAFVYDSSVITDSVQRLREALPSPFDLYYSIKANPNQAILGLVLEQGCGLEVASAGEFYQALQSGCPIKTYDEPGGLVIFDAGPGGGPDASIRKNRPVLTGEIAPVYGFVAPEARAKWKHVFYGENNLAAPEQLYGDLKTADSP